MKIIVVAALVRALDRAMARTVPSRNGATHEEPTDNAESADRIGYRRRTDG